MTDETKQEEKFRCRIGWHRWAKWSEPKVGATTGAPSIPVIIQERRCQDCNRRELRRAT